MNEPLNAAVALCDHHYEYRILGGHPINVGICQICHEPHWDDLAEQAMRVYQLGRDEALAGKPPRRELGARDLPREDEPAVPPVPADTDRPAPPTAPVEWIDGHPQLEATAAAVWERCEHSHSGLIIDDPRNIAVAAFAAVLATLPAPADRAAVLREAANAVAEFTGNDLDANAKMLRRMADEAQQTEACDHDSQVIDHEGAQYWACLKCGQNLGKVPAEEAEALVQVGWWCWRCHGLVTDACRSDNVPIHVPAQWADDMRELIQRRTGGDDTTASEDSASTLTQLADADPEYREVLLKRGEELRAQQRDDEQQTEAHAHDTAAAIDETAATVQADEAQQTEDACVCGHFVVQHFEDVCLLNDCPCQDCLTPEGAIGRAARDRRTPPKP